MCPQTLYKLHPHFDKLLVRILERDPKAIVVFPVAQREEWTESLMARLLSDSSDSKSEYVRAQITPPLLAPPLHPPPPHPPPAQIRAGPDPLRAAHGFRRV